MYEYQNDKNMERTDKTALILIDIQKGFEDTEYWGGHRNNPDAEANAGKLLHFWRQINGPIFHVRHCSTNPDSRLVEGQAGNDLQEVVKPLKGETVIKKNVNSAFMGTDLKERLDNSGIKKLVIAGLTTDHCISSTARMAGDYGFETFVISDATATFDKFGLDGQRISAEFIHETALASLQDEFASVINLDELMKRLK